MPQKDDPSGGSPSEVEEPPPPLTDSPVRASAIRHDPVILPHPQSATLTHTRRQRKNGAARPGPSRTATQSVGPLKQTSIAILYSQPSLTDRGLPLDYLADEETAFTAEHIGRALAGRVRRVESYPVGDDLESVLQALNPREHLIFNLCESYRGRLDGEAHAAHLMEKHGFRHTGASALALKRCANKARAKTRFLQAGVPTPEFQVVRPGESWVPSVTLPAIVKPVAGAGSSGIGQHSLAFDQLSLLTAVEACLQAYRQPALVEEFIAGREFSVAIWGTRSPQVLPLYEIDFRWTDSPYRKYLTFESKWVETSVEYHGTPGVCPAKVDAVTAQVIRTTAQRAYEALGVDSIGRVDLRLRDGIPYILEVNANPSLAPDAGFFYTSRAAGYSYAGMVQQIIRNALEA